MFKNAMKLVLICIAILFITGCKADYNLIVTSDNKVIENIEIYENIDIVNLYYGNTDKAKEAFNISYNSFLNNNKYKNEFKITDNKLMSLLYRKSDSFEPLTSMTFFEVMFGLTKIEETKDYTSFKTVGPYNPNGVFVNDEGLSSLVNQININIQFHNKIMSHNADSYNEKTNTYSWILTEKDTIKSIEFKIGKDRRYDIIVMYLWNNYFVFILLGLVSIIIITVVILKAINNHRKVNKI